MILDVLTYPNKKLYQRSTEVVKFDAPSNVNVSYSEEEHRLGDDMSWLK